MTRPLLRPLPLLALALAGVTALVACGDADTPTSGPSRRSSRTGGTASNETGSEETTTGTPDRTGGTTGTQPGTTPGTGNANNPGTPGSNTTPTTTPDFEVLVANPAATLDMQAETTLQVTIGPKGYAGAVALTATGLPSGATATFSPASVNLTATAGASATVTIKSGSAAPGDSSFKIVGTGGTLTHDVGATLKVNPRITIPIPQNANNLAKAFENVEITKGTGSVTVVWQNPTNEAVTIHRQNNGAGLSHGNPIAPGGSESRTVTATGQFTFYVHNGNPQNERPPGSALLIVR